LPGRVCSACHVADALHLLAHSPVVQVVEHLPFEQERPAPQALPHALHNTSASAREGCSLGELQQVKLSSSCARLAPPSASHPLPPVTGRWQECCSAPLTRSCWHEPVCLCRCLSTSSCLRSMQRWREGVSGQGSCSTTGNVWLCSTTPLSQRPLWAEEIGRAHV